MPENNDAYNFQKYFWYCHHIALNFFKWFKTIQNFSRRYLVLGIWKVKPGAYVELSNIRISNFLAKITYKMPWMGVLIVMMQGLFVQTTGRAARTG